MKTGWNYASSEDQQREEFLAMYKSLTDPDERAKNKVISQREEHANQKATDVGL